MKAKATLETVRLAVSELREQNERPTVRAIMAITGGSPGTISKHLARVIEEETVFEQAPDITPSLLNGLKVEIARHIGVATQQLQDTLSKGKAFNEDLIGRLIEAENVAEEARLEARAEREKFRILDGESGAKIAGAQARADELTRQVRRAEEISEGAANQIIKLKGEIAFVRGQLEERAATEKSLRQTIESYEKKRGDE